MTRKTYNRLAVNFAELLLDDDMNDSSSTVWHCIDIVVTELKLDNQKFDEEKFYKMISKIVKKGIE